MSSVYTVHYALVLKSDGFSKISYTRYFKIYIFLTFMYSKLHIQLIEGNYVKASNKNKKNTELELFTFRGCMYK